MKNSRIFPVINLKQNFSDLSVSYSNQNVSDSKIHNFPHCGGKDGSSADLLVSLVRNLVKSTPHPTFFFFFLSIALCSTYEIGLIGKNFQLRYFNFSLLFALYEISQKGNCLIYPEIIKYLKKQLRKSTTNDFFFNYLRVKLKIQQAKAAVSIQSK